MESGTGYSPGTLRAEGRLQIHSVTSSSHHEFIPSRAGAGHRSFFHYRHHERYCDRRIAKGLTRIVNGAHGQDMPRQHIPESV